MDDTFRSTESRNKIGLLLTALIIATIVSLGDALVYYPLWLLRFFSVVGMPGGIAAWFLNALMVGGPSPPRTAEFVFSLPFNFLAYWMLLSACVEISRMLLPKKH